MTAPPSSNVQRSGAGLSVPLAFLLLLVLLAKVLAATDGNQPYTLDDPYIHLQLARNIAGGSYGINPGEWAAPASSMLWPLLLAPFARSSFALAAPLGLNILFMLVSVWWIEELFRRHLPPRAAVALTLAAAWSFNLFGLPFTGMEHSLQVMLVIILAAQLAGRPVPRPLVYACLLILPWVRYESLAISLPAGLYLWRQETSERARRALALTLAASLLGLLAFSCLLHAHGLGWLPSSVLLKQGLLRSGLEVKLLDTFVRLLDNVTKLRALLALLALAVITPAVRRGAPQLVWVLIASSALYVVFGSCGGFGRYEAHYVAFVLLSLSGLALPHLQRLTDRARALPLVLLFLVVSPELWMHTLQTPLAARGVYEQQYQMGAIVRDFLKAPVAVNDLGLVSFLGEQRVLDLWGLGSYETLLARHADEGTRWMADSVRRHHVEYVFIYRQWLPRVPESWISVGKLSLLAPRVSVAHDSVELLATSPAAAARLASALAAYSRTSQLAAASVGLFRAPDSGAAAALRP